MTSRFSYIVKIAVLGLVVAAYLFLPCVSEFVNSGIAYLRCRNFEGMRNFILSYGMWAPITSIALMALQSMIPLVPGLIITLTNAWIFGWQWGALYSWTGALLGAFLDFGISRWYGRPVVEKIILPKHLAIVDKFFQNHGVIAVFITRLTPIVPFKVVSYGAGLTSISLFQFVVATGVGQTPAIVLYSILGQNLVKNIYATVLITLILIGMGYMAYYYRDAIEQFFFCNRE